MAHDMVAKNDMVKRGGMFSTYGKFNFNFPNVINDILVTCPMLRGIKPLS